MSLSIRNIANDQMSGEPTGIFYFSDVISLQNLLTAMGINEDSTRLTSYNYKDMARRQWRTSLISSYAANLIAVFYKLEYTRFFYLSYIYFSRFISF